MNIDILGERWIPELSLKDIIPSIIFFLNEPNTNNYVNEEAQRLYIENRNKYEETVKAYISKFANYSNYKRLIHNFNFKIKYF